MKLDKLLKPKSIAIIGASEKAGFGGDTTRNFFKFTKQRERVYLVHPKYETVMGQRCWKSLDEIEDEIDLAVVCTNQRTVIPLLEQAAEKGCHAAVVFASGYGESGAEGKKLQQELIQKCEELDIALMGPNCAGFANYVNDIFLFAFETEERERKGNVGIISQSGQIVLAGLDLPGMKFSYVISSGNSANVTVEEYMEFLVDDPDTKVVTAYYEGVKKPEVLERALRKAAKIRKPVIILKTGRTQKSKELANSHTGSLAGSDGTFRALLRKYGVIEAEDLEEMFAYAKMFSTLEHMPKENRFVFMNVSGGEAGVTADLAEMYGICLAELSEETKTNLKRMLPSYATVNNPLDMTASLGYDSERLAQAFRYLFKDPGVDSICLGYTITPEIWDTTVNYMVKAIEMVSEDKERKPIFWLPFIEHTRHKESAEVLEKCKVPLLFTGNYGLKSLKKLIEFIEFEYEDIPVHIPEKPFEETVKVYSEYESKEFLKGHGVAISPHKVALTAEEAVIAAEALGYPVVLKVNSADIMHKSDIGGVKLGLKNNREVEMAFWEIIDAAKRKCPKAKVEGVLVSSMLKKGIEVIVGIKNDLQFGPLIMVGLGGVFVEIFKDVQSALVPLSEKQAMRMIESLKGYPLLNGYRGANKLDVQALARFLVSVSEVAAKENQIIKEMDINPVFVTTEGIELADALLITYGKDEKEEWQG